MKHSDIQIQSLLSFSTDIVHQNLGIFPYQHLLLFIVLCYLFFLSIYMLIDFLLQLLFLLIPPISVSLTMQSLLPNTLVWNTISLCTIFIAVRNHFYSQH